MRAVIQRVSEASVSVNGEKISLINKGLLVLVGIEEKDTADDIVWLSRKITRLRIFPDDNNIMNLSLMETD
jgi:D-aminoacyl-tRNA deacylase